MRWFRTQFIVPLEEKCQFTDLLRALDLLDSAEPAQAIAIRAVLDSVKSNADRDPPSPSGDG